MDFHGTYFAHVQRNVVVFGKPEVRILKVVLQFIRGNNSLCRVHNQQPLKISRLQHPNVQGPIHLIFLVSDNHDRQGSAVQASPPDRVGNLLFDAVLCFHGGQYAHVVFRQFRG